MGYSHGIRWSDNDVKREIKNVMSCLCINRMPTRSECINVCGNSSLANKISRRHGGWCALADEMGLSVKRSETNFGKLHESIAADLIRSLGFSVERMSQNFPYDLLVNRCIKVDVKASRLYKGKIGNFYSFNLEKNFATCDIYILLTVSDTNEITGTYIVPSKFVMQNTQISIGEKQSKYERFKDNWRYIEMYSDFIESVE